MVHKPIKERGKYDKSATNKRMNNCKEENPVKIIRWSDLVTLPSGERAYMSCRKGTYEEVTAFAQEVAKENGVTVEIVI